MAKTWWWRIVVTLVGIIIFVWTYLVSNAYELGICYKGKQCFFQYSNYVDPLAFYSLFLFITSIFLFFINDRLFLKWLRFAGIWIIISVFVLALLPDRTEGLFSFGGPDKETVSIYLGALFVILSLAKIVWDWKKEKRLN